MASLWPGKVSNTMDGGGRKNGGMRSGSVPASVCIYDISEESTFTRAIYFTKCTLSVNSFFFGIFVHTNHIPFTF